MIHVSPLAPPGPGEAVEVAEGILWLRMALPMALDHVNVYALDDGDGWTLVDTGLMSCRPAWEAALAGPLARRPVRRVLVTHHHPDHVGLAGWFQSRGADLVMPRTAWLYARMLVLDTQDRPTPEALAFWRRAGMPDEVLARRTAERPFNFADAVVPMPLGFTRIAEGDRFRAAGRNWVVRLDQGHAPDQATLWDTGGDLVIGADQLLPGISANIGVYPTEPEADPLAEWLASCTRLAAFASDRQLVLPGHKRPYRGLPARLAEMAQGHAEALDRLRAALAAAPLTAWGAFPALYGRDLRPSEQGLALVEAVAHLHRLRAAGEASAEDRADGLRLWHAGA